MHPRHSLWCQTNEEVADPYISPTNTDSLGDTIVICHLTPFFVQFGVYEIITYIFLLFFLR